MEWIQIAKIRAQGTGPFFAPERGLLEFFLDAGVCWSILLRQGYGETGWSDGVME